MISMYVYFTASFKYCLGYPVDCFCPFELKLYELLIKNISSKIHHSYCFQCNAQCIIKTQSFIHLYRKKCVWAEHRVHAKLSTIAPIYYESDRREHMALNLFDSRRLSFYFLHLLPYGRFSSHSTAMAVIILNNVKDTCSRGLHI